MVETALRGMLSALTALLIVVLWVGPQGPPRTVTLTVLPFGEMPASGSGIVEPQATDLVSEPAQDAHETPQDAPRTIPVAVVVPDTSPPVSAPPGPPPSMRSDIPNSAWSPPLVGPQASKPLLMNGAVITGAYQCWDQWGYTTNWTEPVCWPGTAGRPPEHPVATSLTPYLP